MNHQHSLSSLCRLMQIMLVIAMGLVVFISAWFVQPGQPMAKELVYDPVEHSDLRWEKIILAYDNGVIVLILGQMYCLFSKLRRGKFFTQSVITSTKRIGLTMMGAYLLGFLLRMFIGTLSWDSDNIYTIMVSVEIYGILQLLMGLGIFILSYIFEKAKELENEINLVI